MDGSLSQPLVASQADQVPEPERTDAATVAARELNDSEVHVIDNGVRTTPDWSGDTLRPVNADGPTLSQRVQPADPLNASVGPTEPPNDDRRVAADVLHVGCGVYEAEKLPQMFRQPGWREIRLDIDPNVNPDVLASITDMQVISDAAVDAVYSSHNVEHLYPHEVPFALREMKRVLKPNGFAFIKLPDLQEVARFIADGKLEDALYISPVGAIAPLDILYGHRPDLARGNTFMAHRTGFTGTTLGTALIAAGFAAVMVQRELLSFSLTAIAFRSRPGAEQTSLWRARLLPMEDRPTVLYTRND